jgi:tRNA (uracil-5-)-methyltransferase
MECVRRVSLPPTVSVAPRDSRSKLHAASDGLSPWLVDDAGRSCAPIVLFAGDDESSHYRCRCSYQVLQLESPGDNADAGRHKLQYAVRRNHQPVPIQATSDASIANRRIQRAMSELLMMLNDDEGGDGSLGSLRTNLTSVTFSSSWDERDCVLSMNYFPSVTEPEQWKRQACRALQRLNLLQISGRSKKAYLRVKDTAQPICLSDTLVLIRNGATNLLPSEGSWNVRIQPSGSSNNDPVSTTRAAEVPKGSNRSSFELVHYEKPESAFYHPNPYVMCRALSWILHRIEVCNSASPRRDLRLLELYCGCGAHTMAILQSSRGTFRRVVAVENDGRLVRALQRNCQLNDIQCDVQRDSSQPCPTEDKKIKANEEDKGGLSVEARLSVVAQDAGHYVKQLLRRPESAQSDRSRGFDVMLVDPPKQGLDAAVCDFACSHGTLQHVLYVSCGREALLRDLRRLDASFRIVDCVLLDLFPGTSAVETLVHLQKRNV